MEHLFFSISGGFENAAAKAFEALGMQRVEGDSANSPSGVYFEHRVFGIVFKLEENVYDYEDEYDYMMSIKKDVLSNLDVPDEVLTALVNVASTLLVKHLGVKVGVEIGNELRVLVTK